MQHDLQRLRDGPGERDRVIVRGQECPVAEGGSIAMPPDPGRPHGERTGEKTGPWSMAGLPGDIPVDGALIDILRRATGEHDMSRERVLAMAGDMIEQEPIELLLAVAETAPDELGRVAQLIVAVGQSRGERSVWAREREQRARARARDGAHEGAPRGDAPADGVVWRVIDDEASARDPVRSGVGEAGHRGGPTGDHAGDTASGGTEDAEAGENEGA